MPSTWLLTREADDARSDREPLDARGLPVIEVPCVETSWRAWPWAEAAGVTLFTSRRTVRAWDQAGRPPLGDVVTLSPASERALLEVGLVPSLAVEGGVVALAEHLVARWEVLGRPPTLVRYPTSNAGLQTPEQRDAMKLLSLLGEVDRRVVYELRAPERLALALAAATTFGWSITFSSPSAVSHFFAALREARPPYQVVCLGRSTARAWNELRRAGWPEAITTSDLRSTLHEVTA